jgi:hypothetical protein
MTVSQSGILHIDNVVVSGEITATIHNHVTGLTPLADIVIAEITSTITNTPVTPVLLDLLESPAGTIHNHTPSLAIALEVIAPPDTIYIYPNASTIDLVALGDLTGGETETVMNDLLLSGTVNVSIADRMYRGTFEFETSAEAYLSTVGFKTIQFIIPDYAAALNMVFFGFVPSSGANLAPAEDKATLIAFDYAWYLTMQYLSDTDMVLLSLDDQAIQYQYRLNYDYCTDPYLNFAVGDIVVGGTTGHTGKVIENHFSGAWGRGWLLLGEMTGTMIAGHYFQDDEDLNVNGVTFAAADGYTMDYTTIWDDYYPDDWVKRLLGGDEWQKTTGIYPYRIANTATLWNTIQVTMPFDEKTTKMQAIEEVAKYLGYIFMVKWQLIGGVYTPCAYFIPLDEIDYLIVNGDSHNGLDLPSSDPSDIVTLTSSHLTSPATYEECGEEKYNRITVRCQDINGVWYSSKKETDGVKYGDEIPVEYYEINTEIASQAEADTRCNDLYTYYASHIKKYEIALLKRSDLQLYQKINFGGFGTEIPSGNYRIIAIEYSYGEGTVLNETRCTVVPDAQFHAYLNLSRTFTDTISEIRAIVKDELNRIGAVEAGTVTAIDGNKVTIKTERGMTKIVRDAS